MKKEKILIIEDEAGIRESLRDILQTEDYTVLEAKNGKEGLALALDTHPDLILLDLMMPEMDGMTTLKNLRADPWGAEARAIILTNMSATDEALVEQMVDYKPLFYLIKSDWKLADVLKKIKDVFK